MQHPSTEQLTDFLHHALSPEEDAAIYAHLDDCSRCNDNYAAEVRLTEMLQGQASLEERELPPMLKAAIWQQIREGQASPVQRLRAWLRPAYAIPAAAALLVAAFIAPAYLHGARNNNQAPAIDAAYYLQDHAAMNSTIPFSDHTGSNPSEFEMTSNVDQTAVAAVPVTYTADAAH